MTAEITDRATSLAAVELDEFTATPEDEGVRLMGHGNGAAFSVWIPAAEAGDLARAILAARDQIDPAALA